MGPSLSLCTSCQRHIQITETACPFCGVATAEGFAATARPVRSGRPLSRAAILFAGAAAVAGCSSDDGNAVALYGAAPINALDGGPASDGGDASTPVNGGDSAAPIDSGPIAVYGPAPIDSGTDS